MTTRFLDLEPEQADQDAARYVVLPIPYEGTVSYRAGTIDGPAAVIEASTQVELFDEELLGEFVALGIATHPPIPPADSPAEQMDRIRRAAQPIADRGQFLLALGGEHSITAPLVEVASARHAPLSVLQIDAHADLRDQYSDTPHSHAAVMRRVLEGTDRICQVGIRSYSREEFEQCRPQAERFITPRDIASDARWMDRALGMLGERVYVTVDIDGLDPSIAPGVGTPEPGGLGWEDVTRLLRRVCTERDVVGADIVEVRPLGENHITEFLAARLAYKIIAYTQA
jgi:N1-aminopropylagmatine ureohydrolase